MSHAIVNLEIDLEMFENNIPIQESEGRLEEAEFSREKAEDYRAAIAVLKSSAEQ